MGYEDSEDHHERDYDNTSLTATLVAAFSFVAIILVIVMLYFYVKRLHRRQERRRQQYILQRITSQIAQTNVNSTVSPNSGLDPVIIAALPKILYKETEHFKRGEVVECSVCLGTIVEDATIRVLPNCKHMFHVDCVDMWFSSNSTCPVCRAVVEARVQLTGQDCLATQVQAQPTASMVEDGGGVSLDANHHELERVGCAGLRIASFPRMVSSWERPLRRTRSSDGSAAMEDIEKQ